MDGFPSGRRRFTASTALLPGATSAALARRVAPSCARGGGARRQAGRGDGTSLDPIVPGAPPDPTILTDGADCCMTGSSCRMLPGVVIRHSRDLIVQGRFTHIADTLATNTVPHDSEANRLFMEVHHFDPYDVTLNGGSGIRPWGANANDPSATGTGASEPWVDDEFQQRETQFVDQGEAVLIGEYGACLEAKYPGTSTCRSDRAQYVTHSIVRHGRVPVWWDSGELVDRSTGAPKLPDMIRTIVEAAK